jgi:F-type H+-transporting ATPase subunit a
MKVRNLFLIFCCSLCVLLLFSVMHVDASPQGVASREEQTPLVQHLADHDYIELPGITFALPHFQPIVLNGITIDFSITASYIFFLIGIVIIGLILLRFNAGKKVQTSLTGQLIESLVIFIRDDIVEPCLPHDYEKFMPFFLTVFSFIFIENAIGLIPFMSPPTKNISITSALASITLMVMLGAGFRRHGMLGYLKSMMPISKYDMNIFAAVMFNIILFPIELVSIVTKTFALSIRLFANMVAGHAVILTLLLLGWGGKAAGWNFYVSVPSVLGAVFIYLLEGLVVFLQAYVFTLLSAIFIGSALEASH